MGKNSKSKEWEKLRSIEDVKAVIAEIRHRLQVISAHAMEHDPLQPEASFDQVYIEAHLAMRSLEIIADRLTDTWEDRYSEATGKEVEVLRFERASGE